MFTGIIEANGIITAIRAEQNNIHFHIKSVISTQLKVDQSISHDGVCLTVTQIDDDIHQVTAIKETLDRTILGQWKVGDEINLERSLTLQTRLDGHFVQGHCDTSGICIAKEDAGGSWTFRIQFPEDYAALLIDKGSICVNGVSLTVIDPSREDFGVAIIPYTYEHTNFKHLLPGKGVNLEFDILGKYLRRSLELSK